MKITVSTNTDPAFNLNLEERLLSGEEGQEGGDILLLYVNSRSVIVGRNQNPAAEVDFAFCYANNIPILKRISGGGAVYHDTGNINYSFITGSGGESGSSVLDRDFLEPVIAVLGKLGIDAVRGRRKDILLGGRKISGTAATVKKGRALFHGTLLYDTDLSMLEKALRGDSSLRGRRVASVSSPVVNIREYMQWSESTEEFFHRLASAFRELKIEN